MDVKVAGEHIKDGADCISEAIKNLKRVQKSYPKFVEKLQPFQATLESARHGLLAFHSESFQSPD